MMDEKDNTTTQTNEALQRALEYFVDIDIPVLPFTAESLAQLATREDDISPQDIAVEVRRDPLMMAKVLIYVAKRRPPNHPGPVETVESAVLMAGVSPIFRDFAHLRIVDELLADYPDALSQLMGQIEIAWQAAVYTGDLVVYRNDFDANALIEASLLLDIVDLLLWCFMPIQRGQLEEALLMRPEEVPTALELEVLGFERRMLSQGLFARWQMPSTLTKLVSDDHTENPQVKTVRFACNLAAHAADGLDNPALQDDYYAIAHFLTVSPNWVRDLVMRDQM